MYLHKVPVISILSPTDEKCRISGTDPNPYQNVTDQRHWEIPYAYYAIPYALSGVDHKRLGNRLLT
jgi:hypothetical protein